MSVSLFLVRMIMFVSRFTYQVNGVKHLDFAYRGTARIRQVTVIVADGKGTQTWGRGQKPRVNN